MFLLSVALGLILGFPYMLLAGFIISIMGFLFKKYPHIALPLLTALLIRFAMVFLIHSGIIYEGDWDGYVSMAIGFSEGGLKNIFSNFTTGAYFYSWVAGFLFCIFGIELTMFRIVNAFLSTLVVLNVYNITTNLYDEKTAKPIVWVMVLFPTAIIHSSYFCTREPMTIYLFTLSILYLLKWIDNQKSRHFLVFTMLYSLVILLHSGFIFGLAVIIPYMIVKVVKSKNYLFIYIYFLAIAALSGIVLVTLSKGNIDKFSFGGSSILGKIKWFSTSSSIGRAAYLTNLKVNNYFDLLWQCPLRLIYFLFAPFPWMISTIRDVYGIIDSIFYYFAFYCLLKNHRENFKNSKVRLLFILMLVITLSFAFATGNYGTAVRHRAKFYPIYLCLASYSMANLKSKRKTLGNIPAYIK